MNELLESAIKALQIDDVYLCQLESFFDEDVDPKYSAGYEGLTTEYLSRVRKSKIVELSPGNEFLFRVYMRQGIRWVDSEPLHKNEGADGVLIRAMIEAEFIADYKMHDTDVSHDALKEFTLRNVNYHVWPYWRELVMNQCARMHLPRISLPFSRAVGNLRDESAKGSDE